MYEVKIFNPIVGGMETISTFTVSSKSDAMQKAEEFLFSQGIKLGELVKEGDERGENVIGFKDQESIATKSGGFHYVANHIYFVFKHIKEVLCLEIGSFIDLGCGPGNILICAKNLLGASRLTGVEIDPELVRQAKENTKAFGAEIIQDDLLEWTPEINDYDMVYIYDPIRDAELRLKFLSKTAGWLKDGQYVFFHRIGEGVPEWLKKTDIPGYDYPCLYTFDRGKFSR